MPLKCIQPQTMNPNGEHTVKIAAICGLLTNSTFLRTTQRNNKKAQDTADPPPGWWQHETENEMSRYLLPICSIFYFNLMLDGRQRFVCSMSVHTDIGNLKHVKRCRNINLTKYDKNRLNASIAGAFHLFDFSLCVDSPTLFSLSRRYPYGWPISQKAQNSENEIQSSVHR